MLVTEPLLLFLLYCLWRFRTGEAFVLGVGQLGITLADAGTYGTSRVQSAENPLGPGGSSYGQGASSSAMGSSNMYPGAYAPSKGPDGGVGYQQHQPLGSGAPVVMEGTYATHN